MQDCTSDVHTVQSGLLKFVDLVKLTNSGMYDNNIKWLEIETYIQVLLLLIDHHGASANYHRQGTILLCGLSDWSGDVNSSLSA